MSDSPILFYSLTVSPLTCQPALDVSSRPFNEFVGAFRQLTLECTAKTPQCDAKPCDGCGMAFSHISHFPGPEKIHMVEKPYKNGGRAKAFRHPSSFTTQQNMRALEQVFVCNDCENTFTFKVYATSEKHTEPWGCGPVD